MDKLLEYISIYGWAIIIIAVAVIALVGILKLCKVFNKIESKNIKKTIYFGLNIALSFAGSAIYFAIFHKAFTGYVVYCLAQVTVTNIVYSIYEYGHIRTLFQYLLNLFASWVKKNPDSKLAKDLKKLGLGEEQIEEIKNTVNSKIAENTQKVEDAKKAEEVAKTQPAQVVDAKPATVEVKSEIKF